MDLDQFLSKHLNFLESDAARYNLMLGILDLARREPSRVRWWSFGEGGACTVHAAPHYLVVGDLTESQCESFAPIARDLASLGVLGSGRAPQSLAQALTRHGAPHSLAKKQRIYVLDRSPTVPLVSGSGRKANASDRDVFCRWLTQFMAEALPNDPPMTKKRMDALFSEIPIYFWELQGDVVSMAARNRDTREGTNISFVFTPPHLRGKGFGAAVTAHACQESFREGKRLCYLNADLGNPVSNRIYQKIGFRPWCDSEIYRKEQAIR